MNRAFGDVSQPILRNLDTIVNWVDASRYYRTPLWNVWSESLTGRYRKRRNIVLNDLYIDLCGRVNI